MEAGDYIIDQNNERHLILIRLVNGLNDIWYLITSNVFGSFAIDDKLVNLYLNTNKIKDIEVVSNISDYYRSVDNKNFVIWLKEDILKENYHV